MRSYPAERELLERWGKLFGMVYPFDQESTEDYRQRLVAQFLKESQDESTNPTKAREVFQR